MGDLYTAIEHIVNYNNCVLPKDRGEPGVVKFDHDFNFVPEGILLESAPVVFPAQYERAR